MHLANRNKKVHIFMLVCKNMPDARVLLVRMQQLTSHMCLKCSANSSPQGIPRPCSRDSGRNIQLTGEMVLFCFVFTQHVDLTGQKFGRNHHCFYYNVVSEKYRVGC